MSAEASSEDDVRISMIAGVAENGVIGCDQTIPWHIPSDMQFFRKMTLFKPIVMGRKQFETVGKPLPKRTNLVVTRQAGYQPDGVLVISNLNDAIHHAKAIAAADGVDEIMIIGGGEIYRQALDLADRLYISHIDLSPEGEVYFPEISSRDWEVVSLPEVEPDPRDDATFRVKIYERVHAAFH